MNLQVLEYQLLQFAFMPSQISKEEWPLVLDCIARFQCTQSPAVSNCVGNIPNAQLGSSRTR